MTLSPDQQAAALHTARTDAERDVVAAARGLSDRLKAKVGDGDWEANIFARQNAKDAALRNLDDKLSRLDAVLAEQAELRAAAVGRGSDGE